MTDLDNARLDFELHAGALRRALGAGGAPTDLERARLALIGTWAAMRRLRDLLREPVPKD